MGDEKKCACGGTGLAGLPKGIGVGGAPKFKIGNGAWRDAAIEDVARWSPTVALARATGAEWSPYHLNIRAKFTDANVTTLPPVSFEGDNDRLNMISIVDEVTYTINCPTLNEGNALKFVNDWFFTRQSGIQSTLLVNGGPRYVVASTPTPLESLLSSLADKWPAGWLLGFSQSVTMQMSASVPLPELPVNVTVTYRVWQPNGGRMNFVGMMDPMARELLTRMGYSVEQPLGDNFSGLGM